MLVERPCTLSMEAGASFTDSANIRLHAWQQVRNARCLNGNTTDSGQGPATVNG